LVSAAYNEAENLEDPHRRCRAAQAPSRREFADRLDLWFRLAVADNGCKMALFSCWRDWVARMLTWLPWPTRHMMELSLQSVPSLGILGVAFFRDVLDRVSLTLVTS